MIYAFIAMFLAIPIISLIWWISNLVDFSRAKRNNKLNPDTHSKEEMKALKSKLILSSIVAFVLVGVVGGTIVTFALSIVYM